MVQLTNVPMYKVTRGILFGVFFINVAIIFAAIVIYIDAALKLKKQQQIGQRVKQECGQENTEKETERYYIYNAFFENKLSTNITKAIQLLYSTLGFTITGITIAYFFWMLLILNQNDGLDRYRVTKPKPWVDLIGKMSFWVRPKRDASGSITNIDEKIISGSKWYIGWLLYAIVFGLLAFGVVASWLRAANVKQYQVDTISTVQTKTVAEVTKELNETMVELKSRIPGISSPWFSISLIIVYGAFWVYLSKDMKDSDGIAIGRVEKWGVAIWVAILALYFFAIIVAQVMDKDTRGLFASISGVYNSIKATLQGHLQNLLIAETSVNKKTAVRQYFKTWIEAVTPGVEVDIYDINGTGTGEYNGQLWKFLQHRAGKEMDELYASDTSISAWIDEIRKSALQLRMLTKPMHDLTNKFTRNAIIVAMVLFIIITFAIFNLCTRLWSSTGMVIGSLLVVLMFGVISTWFGWFSSALML